MARLKRSYKIPPLERARGLTFGGMILPEMMRWLWRDGPVSTDPKDMVERSFRQPAAKQNH